MRHALFSRQKGSVGCTVGFGRICVSDNSCTGEGADADDVSWVGNSESGTEHRDVILHVRIG